MKNIVLGWLIIITLSIAALNGIVEGASEGGGLNEGSIVVLGLLLLISGFWGGIRLVNLKD